MQISETILLIITMVITVISALFCIISLATPRWTTFYGLFCTGCSTSSAGLSVVALILLVASIIVLLLCIIRILPKSTRILSLVVLFIASIFTLASFAAYYDSIAGYSYNLMVVAHFLCYAASILTAFWLGTSYTGAITQEN
ncbi:unnamed protein product [Rotaria magnacalcarata]|uniref:Uncharacterized protein n=2 Tax=Rotaria magnacalcarata TaxID=392030 RepID=A0A818WFP6_9BILA|nr:unnamed protein product [Rotaria magnacalcarata]CAF1438794.1 unnamed protein product [Rotaria magnacalcarata]CAF1920290.1 unnamed protein product [Rotaria magnacalcarata]CAF2043000.1 unnamed protein product [Rotaria magnacalcarata]CAF3725379.1 unnamed protein product [Rotaria magnacalcarata]